MHYVRDRLCLALSTLRWRRFITFILTSIVLVLYLTLYEYSYANGSLAILMEATLVAKDHESPCSVSAQLRSEVKGPRGNTEDAAGSCASQYDKRRYQPDPKDYVQAYKSSFLVSRTSGVIPRLPNQRMECLVCARLPSCRQTLAGPPCPTIVMWGASFPSLYRSLAPEFPPTTAMRVVAS